ncbi:hypothetical protein SAMN05421812_105415 [Asanoa hainanensis]|uniref:Uncharacterized protein n=1 Tax=Asanoa hainanensis TaxID=560556 RepID=A0A239MFS0_9ACTN|nr:hypothetical protein SAMN05421812_105415 [Asanoa hainanensis]
MKTLSASPYTTYKKINPTWLSMNSSEVCFTTGSMMIGKGTNSAETK